MNLRFPSVASAEKAAHRRRGRQSVTRVYVHQPEEGTDPVLGLSKSTGQMSPRLSCVISRMTASHGMIPKALKWVPKS